MKLHSNILELSNIKTFTLKPLPAAIIVIEGYYDQRQCLDS
jgi:hypothetical protein